MSGGRFDYRDGWLRWQADELSLDVAKMENDPHVSPLTLEYLRATVRIMKNCAARMHIVDWYLSADDGEDTFQKRMAEQIAKEATGE